MREVPNQLEITGISKVVYCNSKVLKWRVPIIATLCLSLLDSVLDAIYFLKISTGQINPLIVVPTWVYRLMLSYLFIGTKRDFIQTVFVYSAIIKEGLVMYMTLSIAERKEFKEEDIVGHKMILMGISYIFEDWVQSSCQYFYFEKYQTSLSIFPIFNGFIMLLMGGILLKTSIGNRHDLPDLYSRSQHWNSWS